MRAAQVGVAAFVVLMTSVAAPRDATRTPTPWTVTPEGLNCELATELRDADGKVGARFQIRSRRATDYWLRITLTPSAPEAQWAMQTTGPTARSFAMGRASDRSLSLDISFGERLLRELGSGRGLTLVVGSGDDARRYTTMTPGEVLRSYERCAAAAKAAPPTPGLPPRWKADSTAGRDCSLSTSLPGFTDMSINFTARVNRPLAFSLLGGLDDRPDGGTLLVDLPGAPLLIDMKSPIFTPRPRDAEVLATLLTLAPVRMTFSPTGQAAGSFDSPTENLAVAGAMFQACAAAVKSSSVPPQPEFTELRYAVSEQGDACELTGTYQIDGNGIWLTLIHGAGKTTFTVTRRTLDSGFLIESLDMSGFGGPKRLEAADATYVLDADALASLRSDLLGAGRKFGIRMSSTEGYRWIFGGPYATVEAPMFDACVRMKSKE